MDYQANGTQTYSVFATASAPIAFAPAVSRVFVRFNDNSFTDESGDELGLTSVAVQTD
jgi:hypothetical protein